MIQVCTELFDLDTKKREIAGSTGLIITEDEEYVEEVESNNKNYKIIVKPIWKWLRAIEGQSDP